MNYSKDFLPIGSAVLLKGADKKVMIIGRAQRVRMNFEIMRAVYTPKAT